MNKKKILLLFTLFTACAGHFLVDSMIGIYPLFKTLAHLDLAIAGLIAGICAFAGEGLQILFGTLCDKGYRKPLLLGGIAATTASSCLVYTDNYFSLFVLYLITCAGSGAFHPCAASQVSDLSEKNKGLFLAIFTSAGAFGMAFSQIFFTSFQSWFNGNVIWMAVPAYTLVVMAMLTNFGYQPPKEQKDSHFDFKIFAKFFRERPLRLLYFIQMCNASMLWGTMFLLPDLLHSRGYESWISFGFGHMMFILGSAIMMIPAGYLADRFSGRKVMFFSTLSALVVFYTLLFSPALSGVAVLATLFCLGASVGVVQPIAISLGTSYAPQHRGMVSAFLMGMVWCFSEGIGQIGGSFLATLFAEDGPAKALSILGLLFLVGSSLSYQLPKTQEVPITIDNL